MLNKASFEKLFDLAGRQKGCFTARQALEAGYSTQSQYYHVRNGDWLRLARGIFRLRIFPPCSRLDLMTYFLWTHDRSGQAQGIFSHETAFAIYPGSVWIPYETHMTVPKSFRRNSKAPGRLKLIYGSYHPEDIQYHEGVLVTKPLRTVLDLLKIGFFQQHYIHDFMRIAFEIGLIAHHELSSEGLSKDDQQNLRKILEVIRYERLEEIRFGSGFPTSSRA